MKNWKLVNFCEFDKYTTKSYCAIHKVDESLNLGDITKVDETKLKPFNMICGGSPCQDFSVAGKQKGSIWTCKDCGEEYNPLTVHWSKRDKCPHCESKNIEKTRSSLLVEYLRVIRANKPNFGIYENVKNIVGKQFKNTTFKLFTDELEEYGYSVHWKVLNAKDYGVPQNRERVYLIFIKKELDNGKFKFPVGFDNGIRLKDILEDEVDEKYYISDDRVKKILENMDNTLTSAFNISVIDKSYNRPKLIDRANCIMTREDHSVSNHKSEGMAILIGNTGNHQKDGIYSDNGIAPTIMATAYKQPPQICVQKVGNVNLSRCGTNGNVFFNNKLVSTLTTNKGENNKIFNGTRIRKLTPKECYRLMAFPDWAFEAVEKEVSSSQLYKQAGNSIVVDVLYYIYVELYKAMPYLFDDLKLSSFFSGIGAFEIALDKLYEAIETGNFTNPQVE